MGQGRSSPTPARVHLHVEVERDYPSNKSFIGDMEPVARYLERDGDEESDAKGDLSAPQKTDVYELTNMARQ